MWQQAKLQRKEKHVRICWDENSGQVWQYNLKRWMKKYSRKNGDLKDIETGSSNSIIIMLHCEHGSLWTSLTTHLYRLSLQATSCIGTELLCIGYSWSSCLCSSMWRGPQEYVAYEHVLTSLVVSHMSGLSNLDSFHDGWKVAI